MPVTPDSSSPFLRFTHVKKTYDQKTLVVRDFSLDVRQGEFVTLLGPSGSGKTTVLMMLAGFEHVTSGTISIQGQPINQTPPYQRNIGVVFQNYALFPHMTVAENLAYPLSIRKLGKAIIKEKVARYLDLIELPGQAHRYPDQLSGGQRQRVALARALIFEPALVLMDEPLGALDKKLREQMQFEITRLHRQLGFTVVYVTHDQVEALTMSDRIAVFNQGVVQQFAAPSALYEQPANAFVAGFIGENNLIPATVSHFHARTICATLSTSPINARNGNCTPADRQCLVAVRPEKIAVQPGASNHDNRVTAQFITRHYVGDFIRDYFVLPTGQKLAVKTLNDARAQVFSEGQPVELGWMADDCFAFKPDSPLTEGA
ncbi:ABC transporter ATP-binding protein [Pusillimonas minor]|uniref:Spermidine/putrescine import ATP-binding protein PotA n=1 Tax=Pusillimonas minor TaxID=2697024 RepID=A0A842HN29_9BURK|nr:ABC transporter ATP-binding protein [Pusillimonas minor]MBC2770259.1 ABC transporter ATP-binding protein [Pusillimonas minor]